MAKNSTERARLVAGVGRHHPLAGKRRNGDPAHLSMVSREQKRKDASGNYAARAQTTHRGHARQGMNSACSGPTGACG